MADLLVIANGKYQSGTAAVRWNSAARRLREIFGNSVEILYTARRGDGVRLAREALHAGAGWIAAAGGDGTVHEVVNGYFDGCRNIRPESSLSFIPCGNGNDWSRTLGLPMEMPAAADSLVRARARRVDVGHARFLDLRGGTEEKIFINVAEAGLGAQVLANLSRRSRRFGGPRSYMVAALTAAFSYSHRRLQLVLDGRTPVATGPLLSVITANGCYFGAGMKCAPMARPDDGLLELIVVGDFAKAEVFLYFPSFMRGTYLDKPRVKHYSVKSVDLTSEDRILFELDGELVGTLPASIRILPQSLQLRC